MYSQRVLPVRGIEHAFAGPFFNEFAIKLPRPVREVNQALLREKIIGPLALETMYPELAKHALVCFTETTTRAQIESLASALARLLA